MVTEATIKRRVLFGFHSELKELQNHYERIRENIGVKDCSMLSPYNWKEGVVLIHKKM